MATWNGLTGFDFTWEEKRAIGNLTNTLKEFNEEYDRVFGKTEPVKAKKKISFYILLIVSLSLLVGSFVDIFVLVLADHYMNPLPAIGMIIAGSFGLSVLIVDDDDGKFNKK